MASKEESKSPCKFGADCYRKNPQHLKDYRHPKRKHDSDEEIKEKKKPKTGVPKNPNEKNKTIKDFFGSKKEEKVLDLEKESEDKAIDDPVPSGSKQNAVVEEEEEETSREVIEESDEESIPSPDDEKENIKRKFLVEMPDDFYEFWEFCCHLSKKKPQDALHALGYQLVGPFDIMAGRHKGVKKNKHGRKPNYLLHWRYYYDPPEFMTVIKGDDKTQFHLGYLRDDPSDMPVMVAANSAAENCTITPKGDNLFAAVKNCIDDQIKTKGIDGAKKKTLHDLEDEIASWAKKKKFNLDLKSKSMKARDKNVVCKTFHGAGIVVPVENDIGYRPVPETISDLKKMMKKVKDSKTDKERDVNMDPIQELITLVQFANDECDYGEGLELGMDLFCYGGKVFHTMIEHLLPLAYQLLGRIEYEQISKEHLKCRKKGADLSELD